MLNEYTTVCKKKHFHMVGVSKTNQEKLSNTSLWNIMFALLHKTDSSQPCNFRLQTRFWLVSAAWPARSSAVFRQVFVERRTYRHSALRLAAPLPRLGLAKALEGLAMLCWVYNDYALKSKILSRRLKQIMLTYMDTVTSQDGWVYNDMNYFRYSIYIARMITADSRYNEKACRFCRKCLPVLGRLELYTDQVRTQIRLD